MCTCVVRYVCIWAWESNEFLKTEEVVQFRMIQVCAQAHAQTHDNTNAHAHIHTRITHTPQTHTKLAYFALDRTVLHTRAVHVRLLCAYSRVILRCCFAVANRAAVGTHPERVTNRTARHVAIAFNQTVAFAAVEARKYRSAL